MAAMSQSPPPTTAPAVTHGASSSTSNPAGPSASASTASSSKSSLLLTPQVMSSFKPAKLFTKDFDKSLSFTSLSFDDKGEQVLTAGEDEAIHLYNCRSGKHVKQLYSKKYGVHLARFTHKSSTIIYASTKEDDTIRYLSLHDNTYLRYFKGHKRRVVSLEMSPADDTFLSGAADDTVRLWDLRTPTCAGMLNVANVPNVSYDPSGMIFAVTLNLKSTTLLYDIRKLDTEPFASISIDDPILAGESWPVKVPVYTSVKFSNDGLYILVGTSGKVHYVLHSFDYKVVARLEGHVGLENHEAEDTSVPYPTQAGISGEEVSWTPDGRYVMSGSNDGNIYIWDVNPPPNDPSHQSAMAKQGPTNTLRPIKVLEGHKGGPSRVVRFNPRSGMFVSGGFGELSFWLPDLKEASGAGGEQAGNIVKEHK